MYLRVVMRILTTHNIGTSRYYVVAWTFDTIQVLVRCVILKIRTAATVTIAAAVLLAIVVMIIVLVTIYACAIVIIVDTTVIIDVIGVGIVCMVV